MAYKRKGSSKWIVSYRVPGQKEPEKEYFNSKREAEAREFEIKAVKKINPGALAPQPSSGITFRELAEAYQHSRPLAATTLSADIYTCEAYPYPLFGNKIVEELTEDDMTAMVKVAVKRGHPGTALRVWERVRAIIRWGKRKKIITKNPVEDFTVEKEKSRHTPMPPSVEEIQAILAVSPPHLVRAIQLAFYLGVRPGASELFALTWEDFNLAEGWVRVQSADKGGLPWRDVPIVGEAIPILTEWQAEDAATGMARPIHYRGHPVSSVKKSWATAKEKAGITRRLRLYDLRHHFATALLEGGADPGIVAGMMGHTTTRMVQEVYQRVRREGKREAISKLPKLFEKHRGDAQTNVISEDTTTRTRQ